MGGDDLLSIAFSSSSHNPGSSCQGWDFHNLGVLNADMSQYMGSSPQSQLDHDSFFEADYSTGYLQDVLFEFSTKRRRLLMFSDDQRRDLDSSFKDCWTSSNLIQDCCRDFDTLSHVTKCDGITDMKTPEEGISETTHDSSSSNSQKESADNYQWTPGKGNLYHIDPMFSSGAEEKRKKGVLAKVVYPFAVVKPGGFEGDGTTLNDINERILMPPTRPVRHPVGDFACRPSLSPEAPGLSGKAVVAFTRIHTQGRGTITIIRTRG